MNRYIGIYHTHTHTQYITHTHTHTITIKLLLCIIDYVCVNIHIPRNRAQSQIGER